MRGYGKGRESGREEGEVASHSGNGESRSGRDGGRRGEDDMIGENVDVQCERAERGEDERVWSSADARRYAQVVGASAFVAETNVQSKGASDGLAEDSLLGVVLARV